MSANDLTIKQLDTADPLRGFREEYRDLIGSRREPFAEELDLGRRVGVRRNVTNLSLKGYELEVGLRLGRRAASCQGIRQRPADRRRKDRARHSGV